MYTQLQLRDSARPPVTVASLGRMKEQGEKISCITCYDENFCFTVCHKSLLESACFGSMSTTNRSRDKQNAVCSTRQHCQSVAGYALRHYEFISKRGF